MTSYRFGFLDKKVGYAFHGGYVSPLPQFDSAKDWIDANAHKDGFLYPSSTWQIDKDGREVANTRRPGHMHRLYASHDLRLDSGPPQEERTRSHASFVIHLIGYLHGTCLQFEDWFFGERIMLRGGHNIHFQNSTAEHFLSHSYQTWQPWSDDARNRFTNVLFMLDRAPSYEWDWERFIMEYMVFDACYKTGADLHMLPKGGKHAERIRIACDTFGIPRNDALAGKIVTLRNHLFHETLWDRAQPGTAPSLFSFEAPFHLRRLNQRLILALLGYGNTYMRSAWWTCGSSSFRTP